MATMTSVKTKTMRAFVMKRVGQVGVMEKPVPEPGPEDAVVKTTAALICTSDAHTVGGAIGERDNITLGHEAVGVVYKLGGAVKGFKEAIASPSTPSRRA